MMITIKQTLLIYTIIVASLVYSITSPLSAEAKKKSDDTLSPKEQSKLTDTQKEDSTVDFNNGDNKCDESHENCGDAKSSCRPGFKLRKGNCVKDVFINVHKKSSGGNNDGGYNGDSPAMKLTSNLPKGCVLGDLCSEKSLYALEDTDIECSGGSTLRLFEYHVGIFLLISLSLYKSSFGYSIDL